MSNNEITNTAAGGIHASSPPHSKNYLKDKVIKDQSNVDYLIRVEYNYIHDFGLGIMNDFGGIKTGSLGQCAGQPVDYLEQNCHTYIHVYNNFLHDTSCYYNGATFLYSDEASGGTTFENNIIYGIGELALEHHCGVDNISKNNIIHRTAETTEGHRHPLITAWGGCQANKGDIATYKNYNNIYLLDDAESFSFGRNYDHFDGISQDFHHNIYWSLVEEDKEKKLFPHRMNWNSWIQSGNDSDSIWMDPMFEDINSASYILAEDSPAWDLGIQQIYTENIGIHESKKRQMKVGKKQYRF